MRFLGTLVVVLLLVGVLAWYLDWIQFATQRDGREIDLSMKVDKEKIDQDTEAAKKKTGEFAEKAKESVGGLAEKAKKATTKEVKTARGRVSEVGGNGRFTISTDENQTLTFQTDPAAKRPDADLKVGDQVSVDYRSTEDGFLATSVKLER